MMNIEKTGSTLPQDKVFLDDPAIHSPTDPWPFNMPPFDLVAFKARLIKIMQESRGIGLAASQLGIPYSIFVIASEPEPRLIVNPKIVKLSEEEVVLEEGCLSFNGVFVKVKRPKSVTLRFADETGKFKSVDFEDMAARVVLHELDHCLGITMIDKAHPIHREKALRKLKQIRRQQS